MKYDVIIIGSGLGGLECAHILSRAGMNVLLLERGTQAGGCLLSYKRRGLAFDTGFHYVGGLYEGQSLHAIFEYLGLLRLPWERLDTYFDRVTIVDRTFAFAQGYDRFVRTLAEDFPAEREALNGYVNMLKRIEEQQFDMLNPQSGKPSFPFKLFETSAYQYLTETFRDPLLINVLCGTSLKMELRRESLPLFTFAHGNSSFIESSWRLKGDGSLIVNSLVDDIRRHGGEILCNSEVQELVEKDGKLVHAVCSNGESYEGNIFISNVHPAVTCDLVKQSDRMKKIYRNRIAGLENTFGMFTVSLCIRSRTLKYFNWNQYVYDQPNVWTFYLENSPVSGVLVSCRIPEDGSEYVQQVDLLTPMLWSKCEPWNMTEVGRRGEEYKAMKKRVAEECIILAERFIPGLRDMITGYYTSTPLTYRDYTLTPEGTAYGLRKDFRDPVMTVLSPRTPIPNLFLTGQNLMLHGLHGVTMTTLFTCAEILGKEHIWNIVKN
ncbi:NAD(P)/FAD-dependent oxidoreductase [Parabacteroides faecis]|uniref:phytoene desaturase family protein n=1 Tax=Parabacteroides faecis TaxID=1217282 RepID=UPI0021644B50|nr:NAD(P)/FAD-dependent oxidoreductase [Parabacteroides faecis]MCS2893594.1 NAD(P)/FAD-dependent oxidoreductase [Parabacteroides faecis]UVQ47808.1 NAD(P)/FAD-dependent oxidoreductase [Parabacteroides faecis]